MLVRCVFVAYFGEEVCHEVINKARENINTILKPNIREILNALKQKVKRGGIVVYLGYAPFFNTENEDCANPEKYQWALATYGELDFFGRSDFLRLTIERRRVFNDLVHQINRAIREVVEELHNDRNKVYDIGFADWSFFPELVDGQFCSPRSTGTYPDFHQPELLFFKQDTRPDRHGPLNNELRRRDETEGVVRGNVTEGDGARPQFDRKPHAMFDGISGVKGRYYPPGTSRNPQTEVKRQLHRRAPAHPDCPGDNSFDWTLGFGLPDGLGQLFHPNPKGHEAMAAFALQTLATVKAQQLDIVVDSCEIQEDTFHCWRGQPLRQAYTQFETVNKLAKQFCERDVVAPPDWDDNWSFSKRYNIAMNGIINRCDTDSDINPLNLKYGGWHTRGNYQYEITPLYRRNHITRADGRCRGEYKVFYSKYYENPDEHNGWEWYASFHTHIWTSNRCFNNLKVQGRSKGYTHKWKANPQLESMRTP
ncbi:uncharacterized protein CTHT_0019900 [Thermochaetoides thermophila DSM 1495]|uniref:Uncharacterized protein n=1 Tax=Chaetomium thermophilum (strain DSM 1495 / CBS 144.50 / IMI 039719) TaxID=759272 RepID=G0S370_CHATD|nr:hypothetical protein CTHT_0019900 [Thermochaetoides thermophila DSM 1495]EGS22453.1 hypothetical protein CTHT_0019900 [Thermochaetoides thermophila DSM 1495]